jgi:hypothetical protein
MKRQITILLLITMVLGILAGCANQSDQQSQPQDVPVGEDLGASIDDAGNEDLAQEEVDTEVTGLEEDLSGW